MATESRIVTQVATADLARILDSLTTSVLLVDSQHTVLHLNVAAETLLGTSRNQAQGRFLGELLRGGDVLLAVIDRVIETQRPYSRRELPLRSVAGEEERVVDCTVSPADELNPSGALLLEINDATQHQRITRENALLAQVGGSRLMIRQLAHEIKNPLGGLRGAAQLLERQLVDATMREYTSVIISEADRLKTLVDTLLGPGHAPRKQLINVHELLQHVWQLLKLEATGKISVTRDYDPSLPTLKLDRDQVIQAMLNLGRNALQALMPTTTDGLVILRTRALTNVYIGTRRHRLVASVQFEDNGPGVPDHLRETLFYPLVTGRAEGTGLGLAVAQDLANRHEGLIEFESRPGRTVFTILLPFDVSDANEIT
ncbi:MAG: PAS domain-containing protein [Candidatus Obscuribacterales bacterium]|nr:PAS domain-containing protein [Steroidobacteraceae bacterium]